MAVIRLRRTEFDLTWTAWKLAFRRLVSRVDVLYVLRIVISRLEHNLWITTGLLASRSFQSCISLMWPVRRLSDSKLWVQPSRSQGKGLILFNSANDSADVILQRVWCSSTAEKKECLYGQPKLEFSQWYTHKTTGSKLWPL
jgi:hypothetical protein